MATKTNDSTALTEKQWQIILKLFPQHKHGRFPIDRRCLPQESLTAYRRIGGPECGYDANSESRSFDDNLFHIDFTATDVKTCLAASKRHDAEAGFGAEERLEIADL